jgi:hypothetical protein
MSRSMVKLIHADNFFPGDDVHKIREVTRNLNYVQMPYGMEIPNFNLIFPDIEIILNKVLGERVIVDPVRSGVIRKPNNNEIHFESFDSTEEWCFVVALEPTTINFWYHIDPTNFMGELASADAKDALQKIDFNYKNLFEWKIHTNILLEPNQCLFFRPWVFHSLQDGMIQYYRLIADKKFRILVMGQPNSSKSSLCKKLVEEFEDSKILKSMEQRVLHKDIDFTEDGQMRHCYRMLNLARKSEKQVTIIDMACPLPKMREILNPDIMVWVSDSEKSQYEELNKIYVNPIFYDIECVDDSDESVQKIIKFIKSKRM